VVTLQITNVSGQATPADATLVVNLPTDFALVSRSGGTLNGTTLTVAIGAIAPGTTMDLMLTFKPLAIVTSTVSLVFTASVAETGTGSTGEVLSNVYVAQIPLTPSCAAPTLPPTLISGPSSTPAPPTSTPVPPTSPPATATPVAQASSTPVAPATPTNVTPATSTPGAPATAPPTATNRPGGGVTSTPQATTRPGGPTGAPATPTGSVSNATAAATPSHKPTAPAAGAGGPARATATPRVYVTVVTHYRTVVVSQTKTVTRYKSVPRYKTVTVTHYKTVPRYKTIRRYKTITVTRYKTVPRYKTVTLYQTQHRTVVTYKVVVRQQVHQVVRMVVHHKTVMRTVTRVVNKTVIHHKTEIVKAIEVMRHPTTGRFAAPQVLRGAAPSQTAPPFDVTMSIPRLSISNAPVWTRGYQVDQAGGLTYDIVPFYGLTRFSYSVPFGTSGLTMVYGHDDIFGSIFRYLSNLKPRDRVTVAAGRHRYTYVVRSVSVVSPTDVSMITAPRERPTLALISCTPYWVDTHRVVVIAQMQ
jgi:LPXTG-site transpeptidase (sortase) family protein